MGSIDREKFGAFVAARRREKGLTQQELADRLFLSNKAVSKWETGQSLPDIALLDPLAECLEVSVAELLRGERAEKRPLEADETEELVGRAIHFADDEKTVAARQRWKAAWCAAAVFGVVGTVVLILQGYRWDDLVSNVLLTEALCLTFGFWVVFCAPDRLPRYYDENRVTTFSQGPVRMSLGGIRVHNGNWPHILEALRWWLVIVLAGFPAVYGLLRAIVPQWGLCWELGSSLTACLGLFIPVMAVAKRYK